MEEKGIQSTLVPGPWMPYKRIRDAVKVEARWVTGRCQVRLVEVREFKGEDLCCPTCKTVLSEDKVPSVYVMPDVFFEQYYSGCLLKYSH